MNLSVLADLGWYRLLRIFHHSDDGPSGRPSARELPSLEEIDSTRRRHPNYQEVYWNTTRYIEINE